MDRNQEEENQDLFPQKQYACEDAIKATDNISYGVFVPASDTVFAAVEYFGYPFRQALRRESGLAR